jgi:hypothetical protein
MFYIQVWLLLLGRSPEDHKLRCRSELLFEEPSFGSSVIAAYFFPVVALIDFDPITVQFSLVVGAGLSDCLGEAIIDHSEPLVLAIEGGPEEGSLVGQFVKVDLIDVFLYLLSVVLPKRVGKQSLGFVLDVMLENLRFKI